MKFDFKNCTVEFKQESVSKPAKANEYSKLYLNDIRKLLKGRLAYGVTTDAYKTIKRKIKVLIQNYRRYSDETITFKVLVTSKKYPNRVYDNYVEYSARDARRKFCMREYAKSISQNALKVFRYGISQNKKVIPPATTLETPFGRFKVTHKKAGRTFADPGQILKLHIKKNCGRVFTAKTPETHNRHIGIEIEFCSKVPQDTIVLDLHRSGLYKFVQLKEDRSLRPKKSEFGYEFAILLRETSYKRDLKKITDYLGSIKAVAVNRRCGLHVHLDMRKRHKETVYNNLVACQEALWKIIDPGRYDNEFCRIVHSPKFPVQFNNTREERYKTINAASYFKHSTIEVRMHQGSVDFKAICNWVDLLVRIANFKRKLKGSVLSLFSLKKRVKIPNLLFNRILDQSRYWQVNGALRPDNEDLELTENPEITVREGVAMANPTFHVGIDDFTLTVPNPPIVRRG